MLRVSRRGLRITTRTRSLQHIKNVSTTLSHIPLSTSSSTPIRSFSEIKIEDKKIDYTQLHNAPYVPHLPLVPLSSSRPGLPGSSFRWTWPRHAETQNILQTQLNNGTPYFALFLMKDLSKTDKTDKTKPEEDTLEAIENMYHNIGTICSFRIDGTPGTNNCTVTVYCLRRIKMIGVMPNQSVTTVQIQHLDDTTIDNINENDKDNITALMSQLRTQLSTVENIPDVINRLRLPYTPRGSLNQPGLLADYCAALSSASPVVIQEILNKTDLNERMYQSLLLLKQDEKIYNLQKDILKKVDEHFTEIHTRNQLKQQKKIIDELLGNKGNKDTLIAKFEERISKLTLSSETNKLITDELDKLRTLDSDGSEYNITRNYLEWLTNIPFGIYTEEKFDLIHAENILNQQHYGMEDIKNRIMEFIAVGRMLGNIPSGKIVCLVGPPGVGKTSIGKSIAMALNRSFYRFSVGGLDDVTEIKGHRRTYVGSMPGKMIQALKSCQTMNPVILIDEIDKLGRNHRGDPASALLEVLDPEQNNHYMDHYVDTPVDLSKVLFICTANDQNSIPGPLADRMDFINLSGYILQEKINITKTYLIPTITKSTGLSNSNISITDDAIECLIKSYCREPGVRNLQKQLDKIYRKIALKIARGTDNIQVTKENLSEFVGKPIFTSDRLYTNLPIGVAMGLAYTSMGGASVFIESTLADQRVPVDNKKSKGKKSKTSSWVGGHHGNAGLYCTGQMGDVMKESSSIAYTVAKRYLPLLSPENSNFFSNSYIHMHIPAGGTPKDGPSAGITMTVSLLSLALNIPMSQNLAMTGELTLTGKVVAIGGVKEKLLAAKRANVTQIIFPKENQNDWDELPNYLKSDIEVTFVSNFDEVLRLAFPNIKLPEYNSLCTLISKPNVPVMIDVPINQNIVPKIEIPVIPVQDNGIEVNCDKKSI